MRIILSGGWGFGNLGDDAILLVSIKLLQQKYPLSEIVIITNNVKETEHILLNQSMITIEESVFKKVFGDIRTNISMSISQKIRSYTKKKIGEYAIVLKQKIKDDMFMFKTCNKQNSDAIESFRRLCESANMYIMSGGGYLNDWKEMSIAKHIESTIANEQGLKCYLIGQTIGPFISRNSFRIVNNICSLMQGLLYRDVESIKDTRKMGLECYEEPIPDLALYEEFFFVKKKQIVIIPFRKDIVENIDNFCRNIEIIAESTNLKIIVAVTQLWYSQIEIALFIYNSLMNRNVDVEMFIPKDVFELQRILGESQLVISQNLHGLIMAYRSCTPVISLNLDRKFVTFMSMIDASGFMIEPKCISGYNLYDLCRKRFDVLEKSKMKLFINQIENTIDKVLK